LIICFPYGIHFLIEAFFYHYFSIFNFPSSFKILYPT